MVWLFLTVGYPCLLPEFEFDLKSDCPSLVCVDREFNDSWAWKNTENFYQDGLDIDLVHLVRCESLKSSSWG